MSKNTNTENTLPKSIKKTAEETFLEVLKQLENKELSELAAKAIIKTLEKKVGSKSSATGEKVVTTLTDDLDNVIGKLCNVTQKWFKIDRFAPKSGRVKEIDSIMKKEYSKISSIKKQAQKKFEEITLAKPEDKIKLLTEYEELVLNPSTLTCHRR